MPVSLGLALDHEHKLFQEDLENGKLFVVSFHLPFSLLINKVTDCLNHPFIQQNVYLHPDEKSENLNSVQCSNMPLLFFMFNSYYGGITGQNCYMDTNMVLHAFIFHFFGVRLVPHR